VGIVATGACAAGVGAAGVGAAGVSAAGVAHHQDRNPPIRRGQGIGRQQRIPVGVADHRFDPRLGKPPVSQQPAGRVGPFGRQLPVRAVRAGERRGVGVPRNRQWLMQFHQDRHDFLDEQSGSLIGRGRSGWEHRQFDFVDDLDSEPIRGHVDGELLGKVCQLRIGVHGLFDFVRCTLEGRLFLTGFFGGDLGLGNGSWIGRLALALDD
jgi:hypothetical protein